MTKAVLIVPGYVFGTLLRQKPFTCT